MEQMRYHCGAMLARRDDAHPDTVAGVPDSGTAHAIGYANESGIPFSRPFIKYTPTWPRSFMPTMQSQRNLIAKMKLIPVHELIQDRSLLLIDDSIVRGTQLRETTDLNFSRSTSVMDLITRRVIQEMEGTEEPANLVKYADPESGEYNAMVEYIGKKLNFTSLRYHRLDDMIQSVGIDKCKLCTYCWDGQE